MKAPTRVPHFTVSRPLPTPAQLVRAEAKRRGGHFAQHADHYAALAERWYGRRPLHGDELRVMYDDVFGND
ncbi:hypothetical protein AAB992_14110 [Burkholderia contaminans]|uniref:hypothetical protein n=1 Tax=Burkholderia contaminans TaxID=488447 RepID=UPI002415A470|nr:hypothetical protein [Burkholderia contaminans]WFN14392.1 hypothetical protein LXE92_36405 [Burkholderia contaminans]